MALETTILGVNYETIVTTDLTFTDGTINSVAVAAGDTILVSLFRGAGSNTDTSWVIPSHTGVLI